MSVIEITKRGRIISDTSECMICTNQTYYVMEEQFTYGMSLDNFNYFTFVTKSGNPATKFLENEFRVLSKLDNKYIIKVLGYNLLNNTISLEYILGRNLIDYINEEAVNLTEIENLTKQMIKAVDYCHEVGILHCDIKPDNFIITPDNKVKLIDFEFSTLTPSSEKVICGTIEYIPPEIADSCGSKEKTTTKYSKKSDIWSLGVTLFCLRYKKSPFLGICNSFTINNILYRKLRFDDSNYSNLLKGMLHKDVNLRYSMEDIKGSYLFKKN